MQNNIKTVIEQYLNHLQQAGYSPSTKEKYGFHLEKMNEWMSNKEITQIQQITRCLLWEWGASLHEYQSSYTKRKWSIAMIRQGIAAARSFLKWCEKENLATNLANALKLPKQKKRIQRTINEDEIRKLLNICDNKPKGQRDTALIALLVDSGLRASEICNLKIKNLHFDTKIGNTKINMFTVITKGGNEEIGYFGDNTAKYLKIWLKTHKQKSKCEEVFISLGGIKPNTKLSRQGLKTIFRKLAIEAKIDHFSPHAFRRAFACISRYIGADSTDIKDWGRWSNIEMVELYTLAYNSGIKYKKFSPMDYINKQDN